MSLHPERGKRRLLRFRTSRVSIQTRKAVERLPPKQSITLWAAPLPREQECHGRRILLTQRLISVRWEEWTTLCGLCDHWRH